MAQTVSPPNDDAISDDALIRAVARRDAAAFRELIARHGPMLHRLGWHILGNASDAEDIVQETMVRLWDRAADWQSRGGGAPAWLRRIATNLCLDRLRLKQRISDAPVPDSPDPTQSAAAAIDEDRMARAAREAIAALPDRQRAAVVLTYYQDLSNAAAAATLDMNIKAFESLLLRARAALREHVARAGVTAEDLEERA